MARRKSKGPKPHTFRNKLILNQWLISLFGIDPLDYNFVKGKKERPFHKLVEPILYANREGLDRDNLHYFYHDLVGLISSSYGDVLSDIPGFQISRSMLLVYERNIVRHTLAINERRKRPVVWKYYQWMTLLFVEIYLDRFFGNRNKLLDGLNDFVEEFNRRWIDYTDIPLYEEDDLNKLCLQNATGSGKTLLMHVNFLQYKHYTVFYGKDLSKSILLTPNERLSEQHINEFRESNINARPVRNPSEASQSSIYDIDVFEITKLGDKEGPGTIATRSLGDQNLLLVDEGHRGMSGKEEGAWFARRGSLCAKGFTFEYSATFEQAVKASRSNKFENSYARSILFDYSYRWFYEDGFGKDYQILNLPKSFEETRSVYLTACLLKFYQQLRIYEENRENFKPFNLEKPLWIFVGNTVSKSRGTRDEKTVVTDIAWIVIFIAEFLSDERAVLRRIEQILNNKGQDTGLLDEDGHDIFEDSFRYLARVTESGETLNLYRDILSRLFNNSAGGSLYS